MRKKGKEEERADKWGRDASETEEGKGDARAWEEATDARGPGGRQTGRARLWAEARWKRSAGLGRPLAAVGRRVLLGWASSRIWAPFLFLFYLSFLFLIQTKFEFKYEFEFKPHSNRSMHQHECNTKKLNL